MGKQQSETPVDEGKGQLGGDADVLALVQQAVDAAVAGLGIPILVDAALKEALTEADIPGLVLVSVKELDLVPLVEVALKGIDLAPMVDAAVENRAQRLAEARAAADAAATASQVASQKAAKKADKEAADRHRKAQEDTDARRVKAEATARRTYVALTEIPATSALELADCQSIELRLADGSRFHPEFVMEIQPDELALQLRVDAGRWLNELSIDIPSALTPFAVSEAWLIGEGQGSTVLYRCPIQPDLRIGGGSAARFPKGALAFARFTALPADDGGGDTNADATNNA